MSAVGLKRDLLLENLSQEEWTKTGIMTLGCNAAQGRETGDFSMETKKTVKDVKKIKWWEKKWEMKTSLHLIKHIIRRHSKRDWGKHYVDFQKETRDISHGQSTSMSSTHTHSFCYKHSQEKDTADYKSQQDAHKQRNSHWRCSCLHHKTQTVLQRVHQRTFGFQNKHIWSDTCAEKKLLF